MPSASSIGGAKPDMEVSAAAGKRLLRVLEVLHLLGDRVKPQHGVVDVDGELGEHRGHLVLEGSVPNGLPVGIARTDRHGYQRAYDTLNVLVAGQEQFAEPVGDARQHHVVERPAQRLADSLDVVDRRRRPGVAPVRAEWPVQA